MIHLKQPLVLSVQSNVGSPLFASPSSAAASCQQKRGTGGRSRRWLVLQRISCSSTEMPLTVSSVTMDRTMTVTATVTVQPPLGVVYAARGLDDLGDLFGKTLLLELVSSELDPKTGLEKERVVGFAHKTTNEGTYEAKFSVPASFGPVGAVMVENEHHKEMFIKGIKLVTGDDESTAVTFDCNSWAHSKFDNPDRRVFFPVKSYLPSQTPKGIEALRKRELETLRGDGRGERKFFERVYDYDVYNDLGDPDRNPDHKRAVLGGKEHPYPRRCRTGRPSTESDPQSEKRSGAVYVPPDEQFSEVKGLTFSATTLRSGLHAVLPALEPLLSKHSSHFTHFPAIDSLYSDGIQLPGQSGASFDIIRGVIPRVVRMIEDTTDHVLRFEVPAMVKRDRFSWFRDEEFARQTLAGLNPVCIQLLTVRIPHREQARPGSVRPAGVCAHQGDPRGADERPHDGRAGAGAEAVVHPGLSRRVPAVRAQGARAAGDDAVRLAHGLLPHRPGHADAAGDRADAAAVADEAAVEARFHARVRRHRLVAVEAGQGERHDPRHRLPPARQPLAAHALLRRALHHRRQPAAQPHAPRLPPPPPALPLHHGDQRAGAGEPHQRRRHHRGILLAREVRHRAQLRRLRRDVAVRHGGASRGPRPAGASRPPGRRRARAHHQGLPVRQRRAPGLELHQAVGVGLREVLLQVRRGRRRRRGAAGVVGGGAHQGPRGQEGRAVVAGGGIPGQPGRGADHHHVGHLRPPRRRQLRSVPLRRLLPQPPDHHAEGHAGGGEPRAGHEEVHGQAGGGAAGEPPLADAGHQDHGHARHPLLALPRRGVHGRVRRTGVAGRAHGQGGLREVQRQAQGDRGHHRREQQRPGAQEPVRRRDRAVRVAQAILWARGHREGHPQQHLHLISAPRTRGMDILHQCM